MTSSLVALGEVVMGAHLSRTGPAGQVSTCGEIQHRETGADMKSKCKETARGGLAMTAIAAGELRVGLPEC